MLWGKPTKAKSSSMNNSYAGITRFRFIGYNLSHIGTPLFYGAKIGIKNVVSKNIRDNFANESVE